MYCPRCGTPLSPGGQCPKCSRERSSGYLVALVVAIPALLLLAVFLLLPFFHALLLSLEDYNLAKGLFGSNWVGLENFSALFSSTYFPQILRNSFVMGLGSFFLGSGYVFAASYGLACVKNSWARCGIVSALLLPVLLPAADVAAHLSPAAFLQSPALYPLLPILSEVFCIAPIAVAAGMFVRGRGTPARTALFVAGCYACVRLALLFSGDAQFLMLTYNPQVYSTADTFSTFQYRNGLQEGQYSFSSAVFITKFLLQLIPAAAGAIGLVLLARRPAQAELRQTGTVARALAALPFALIGIIVFFIALVRGAGGMSLLSNELAAQSILLGIVYAVIGCVLAGLVAGSLACAMSAGGRIGSAVALCVGIALLLCTGNEMGHYLQMRQLGLVNSAGAVIIQYMLYGLFGAFLLFAAAGGRTEGGLSAFLRTVAGSGVVLLGIAFAIFFSNAYVPMLYLTDRNSFPIGLVLRQLLMGASGGTTAPGVQAATLAVDVLPVAAGLAALWLGSWLDRRLHKGASIAE